RVRASLVATSLAAAVFGRGPVGGSAVVRRVAAFGPPPVLGFLGPPDVATLRPSARWLPGRNEAYGPTWAPGPITDCTAWARTTDAPSPTTVSIRLTSGPTVAPSSIMLAPRTCVFRSITASRPSVAVTSIPVAAG